MTDSHLMDLDWILVYKAEKPQIYSPFPTFIYFLLLPTLFSHHHPSHHCSLRALFKVQGTDLVSVKGQG